MCHTSLTKQLCFFGGRGIMIPITTISAISDKDYRKAFSTKHSNMISGTGLRSTKKISISYARWNGPSSPFSHHISISNEFHYLALSSIIKKKVTKCCIAAEKMETIRLRKRRRSVFLSIHVMASKADNHARSFPALVLKTTTKISTSKVRLHKHSYIYE